RVFVAGSIGRTFVESDLFLVANDLVFQLADVLSRAAERVGLAIEAFVAMTAHATALVEEVAPKVQRVGALRHAIFCVTLLAAGLGVFFFKHRPQPKLVPPVAFDFARGSAAVSPVTAGTTKLIRRVNLQNF